MVNPTVNSTNQFNSSFQNLTTNNISTAFQTTSPFVMTRVWWCHCIPQHLHVYSWCIESKIESTTGLFSLLDLKFCSYISVHSSAIVNIIGFSSLDIRNKLKGGIWKTNKKVFARFKFLAQKGAKLPPPPMLQLLSNFKYQIHCLEYCNSKNAFAI